MEGSERVRPGYVDYPGGEQSERAREREHPILQTYRFSLVLFVRSVFSREPSAYFLFLRYKIILTTIPPQTNEARKRKNDSDIIMMSTRPWAPREKNWDEKRQTLVGGGVCVPPTHDMAVRKEEPKGARANREENPPRGTDRKKDRSSHRRSPSSQTPATTLSKIHALWVLDAQPKEREREGAGRRMHTPPLVIG